MNKKDLENFTKKNEASMLTMEVGGAAIGAGGAILGVGISKKDRAVITLGAVLATAGFIFTKKAAKDINDEMPTIYNQINEYNELKKRFANHLFKDIENTSYLNGYMKSIIDRINNATNSDNRDEVKSE